MTKKSTLVGLACVLMLLVGWATLGSWTVTGLSIRDQLDAQVRALTGLDLRDTSRTTFSLLPRPRIKLEGVALRDADEAVRIDAASVRGNLRIWPLLLGRLEVADLRLRAPSIFIDMDRRPLGRRGALARVAKTPASSPDATALEATRLGIVKIEGGEINVVSRKRGLETRLDSVDATLDWRSFDRPASLVGTAGWEGHPVDLSAWLGRPAALLRGDTSAVNVRLETDDVSVVASGNLTSGDSFGYQGKIQAATTDLPGLMRLLPSRIDWPESLARASLEANAVIDARSADLSNLEFTLGDSAFEGSLAVRPGVERPLVSATLATELLEIAPFVAPLPAAVTSDGHWTREPLPLRLDLVDLDLRVSAAKARFGRLELSDLALAAMAGNGRAEISVGDAKAYGGALKFRVSLARAAGGQTLRTAIGFSRVDMGALLLAGWRIDRLSGLGTGQFAGEANGNTLADWTRSLSGEGHIAIEDGEINGIDIEQALRRVDKRPLSIGGEMRTGRTGFSAARGAFSVAGGVATLHDFGISGPGASLALTGDIGLADRTLDVGALARQSGDAGRGGPQLRLEVRGAFDDPHLVLDAASLVRRSEAAAPLFVAPVPAAPVPAESAPAEPATAQTP